MRSFKILPVVAAGLSIASPLAPRATTPVVNDNVILNYVLSLVRIVPWPPKST